MSFLRNGIRMDRTSGSTGSEISGRPPISASRAIMPGVLVRDGPGLQGHRLVQEQVLLVRRMCRSTHGSWPIRCCRLMKRMSWEEIRTRLASDACTDGERDSPAQGFADQAPSAFGSPWRPYATGAPARAEPRAVLLIIRRSWVRAPPAPTSLFPCSLCPFAVASAWLQRRISPR